MKPKVQRRPKPAAAPNVATSESTVRRMVSIPIHLKSHKEDYAETVILCNAKDFGQKSGFLEISTQDMFTPLQPSESTQNFPSGVSGGTPSTTAGSVISAGGGGLGPSFQGGSYGNVNNLLSSNESCIVMRFTPHPDIAPGTLSIPNSFLTIKVVSELLKSPRHTARSLTLQEAKEKYLLSHVELTFREQCISRADTFLISQYLVQRGICLGEELVYDLNQVTVSGLVLKSTGTEVINGLVDETTKFTFQSLSYRAVWLFELSSELWWPTEDGKRKLEWAVHGFVRELVNHVRNARSVPVVTVIIYGRTVPFPQFLQFEKNGELLGGSASNSIVTCEKDIVSRVIVARTHRELDSIPIEIYRQVDLMQRRVGRFIERVATDLSGIDLSAPFCCARQANTLEAINIAFDSIIKQQGDRELNLSGSQLVVVTCGQGLLYAKNELAQLTAMKILDHGIRGCYMVCVADTPPHAVPLFQYSGSDNALKAAKRTLKIENERLYYEIPKWLTAYFYYPTTPTGITNSTNKSVSEFNLYTPATWKEKVGERFCLDPSLPLRVPHRDPYEIVDDAEPIDMIVSRRIEIEHFQHRRENEKMQMQHQKGSNDSIGFGTSENTPPASAGGSLLRMGDAPSESRLRTSHVPHIYSRPDRTAASVASWNPTLRRYRTMTDTAGMIAPATSPSSFTARVPDLPISVGHSPQLLSLVHSGGKTAIDPHMLKLPFITIHWHVVDYFQGLCTKLGQDVIDLDMSSGLVGVEFRIEKIQDALECVSPSSRLQDIRWNPNLSTDSALWMSFLGSFENGNENCMDSEFVRYVSHILVQPSASGSDITSKSLKLKTKECPSLKFVREESIRLRLRPFFFHVEGSEPPASFAALEEVYNMTPTVVTITPQFQMIFAVAPVNPYAPVGGGSNHNNNNIVDSSEHDHRRILRISGGGSTNAGTYFGNNTTRYGSAGPSTPSAEGGKGSGRSTPGPASTGSGGRSGDNTIEAAVGKRWMFEFPTKESLKTPWATLCRCILLPIECADNVDKSLNAFQVYNHNVAVKSRVEMVVQELRLQRIERGYQLVLPAGKAHLRQHSGGVRRNGVDLHFSIGHQVHTVTVRENGDINVQRKCHRGVYGVDEVGVPCSFYVWNYLKDCFEERHVMFVSHLGARNTFPWSELDDAIAESEDSHLCDSEGRFEACSIMYNIVPQPPTAVPALPFASPPSHKQFDDFLTRRFTQTVAPSSKLEKGKERFWDYCSEWDLHTRIFDGLADPFPPFGNDQAERYQTDSLALKRLPLNTVPMEQQESTAFRREVFDDETGETLETVVDRNMFFHVILSSLRHARCAFTLQIKWLVSSSHLVSDWVSAFTHTASKYGQKVIPVPSAYGRLDNPLLVNYTISDPSPYARCALLHLLVSPRMGYFPDTPEMNCNCRLVHKSGLALVCSAAKEVFWQQNTVACTEMGTPEQVRLLGQFQEAEKVSGWMSQEVEGHNL